MLIFYSCFLVGFYKRLYLLKLLFENSEKVLKCGATECNEFT